MVRKKVGKKWKLYDKSGKELLGTHSSKASLEKHERKIQIEKAKRKVPGKVSRKRR